MSSPAHGAVVGLEIPVKDTARAAAFYTAVFGWTSAPSHLGAPAEKILVFHVPGKTPMEGIFRRVEEVELTSVKGVSKVYLNVDDIGAAMDKIVDNGGQKESDVIPEGDKASFQFFRDSEGNGHAIYALKK